MKIERERERERVAVKEIKRAWSLANQTEEAVEEVEASDFKRGKSGFQPVLVGFRSGEHVEWGK